MIYVTHDQVEAMTLADTIVLLNAGDAMQRDGSVAQVGKPLDLYHRPANLFVAGFIGSPPAWTPAPRRPAIASRLGCGRSMPASLPAGIVATASYVEQLGGASYLYLECSALDGFLVVRQDGDAAVAPSQQVTVDLPDAQCHLLDGDGRTFPRTTAAVLSDRVAILVA